VAELRRRWQCVGGWTGDDGMRLGGRAVVQVAVATRARESTKFGRVGRGWSRDHVRDSANLQRSKSNRYKLSLIYVRLNPAVVN
jgi:hypothetical protein